MVNPRHAGAASLASGMRAELDQTYDAESVRTPRLERLGQLIVVKRTADQSGADVLADVIVAERDCVGIAEGAAADLGSGPHADAGDAAQASIDGGMVVGMCGGEPFELRS